MSATLTRDLIVTQTRALKLPGIARTFEPLARQARDAHWPHEEYLHEVLSAEQASRHESVIRHRLRDAASRSSGEVMIGSNYPHLRLFENPCHEGILPA